MKTKTAPELTTRRIRVYKKYSIRCANLQYQSHYRMTPLVTLGGIWLEQADFKPGDYVDIQVEEGKLTLTRKPWIERK